jgi:hypothetical protein
MTRDGRGVGASERAVRAPRELPAKANKVSEGVSREKPRFSSKATTARATPNDETGNTHEGFDCLHKFETGLRLKCVTDLTAEKEPAGVASA